VLAACIVLAALLGACGGGGDGHSVSNASASNVRLTQSTTITFNGAGLDEGVEVQVSGPCSNLQRMGGATPTTLQYSCRVEGVGRITASAVSADGTRVYGRLAFDVPEPRVLLALTDGTWSGTLTLDLDARSAPQAVTQFLEYVNGGFYRDTIIHRARPGVGILGGGYVVATDGALANKVPTRPALPAEPSNLPRLRGAIGMVRPAGTGSANAIFFIGAADNAVFDVDAPDEVTVFGRLEGGLDVLDKVAAAEVRPDLATGLAEVPVPTVTISAALQSR